MIDWDALVLAPVMGIFGAGPTGSGGDQTPLYTPVGGGTTFPLADAVFDREYLQVVLQGDGSENTTARPVLGVRTALFALPPQQGDRVTIPAVGLTYIVREVQPDGHGHAKLMLNVVAS